MATINDLPVELIDIILGYNISVEDVLNFKSTCQQFWSAAHYKKNWERKLSKRWPSARKVYDEKFKKNDQKESEKDEQNNQKRLNFIEAGINCARQLQNLISEIIDKSNNYSIENSASFKKFQLKKLKNIIVKPKNFMANFLFMDEMKYLLTQSSRRADCDLIKRNCIKNMYCYLRRRSLREKWEIFKQQPQKEQLWERSATIFAQWIQPEKDIFYSRVKTSLNNIAQEVLKYLEVKHPNHSIFSTSAETFSYWENNNIVENYWDEEEGTQIMDTLTEYIFGKLNFKLNYVEDTKLENMCIDNVLENKYGQGTILLIIYHSVARRLGLRCDIIKLHTQKCIHICIFWQPNYATDNLDLENLRCFKVKFAEFPDCIDDQWLLCRTLHLESLIPTAVLAKEVFFMLNLIKLFSRSSL